VTLAFANVIASVLCETISPMKRGITSAEKLPRNDTITYLFTTTQILNEVGLGKYLDKVFDSEILGAAIPGLTRKVAEISKSCRCGIWKSRLTTFAHTHTKIII